MTKDDLTDQAKLWYDRIQQCTTYEELTALDAEATAAKVMDNLPPRDLAFLHNAIGIRIATVKQEAL